jgi:hypothetical protein
MDSVMSQPKDNEKVSGDCISLLFVFVWYTAVHGGTETQSSRCTLFPMRAMVSIGLHFFPLRVERPPSRTQEMSLVYSRSKTHVILPATLLLSSVSG